MTPATRGSRPRRSSPRRTLRRDPSVGRARRLPGRRSMARPKVVRPELDGQVGRAPQLGLHQPVGRGQLDRATEESHRLEVSPGGIERARLGHHARRRRSAGGRAPRPRSGPGPPSRSPRARSRSSEGERPPRGAPRPPAPRRGRRTACAGACSTIWRASTIRPRVDSVRDEQDRRSGRSRSRSPAARWCSNASGREPLGVLEPGRPVRGRRGRLAQAPPARPSVARHVELPARGSAWPAHTSRGPPPGPPPPAGRPGPGPRGRRPRVRDRSPGRRPGSGSQGRPPARRSRASRSSARRRGGGSDDRASRGCRRRPRG